MPDAQFALVLTADAASGALSADVTEQARSVLPGSGAARWLSPDAAVEWLFGAGSGDEACAVREAVAARLHERPIDINVMPADPTNRMKRLLVADMDSTLIGQEMIDELAELAGRRDEIAAITLRAMRGEMDFESSLAQRVGRLAGLTIQDLERACGRITLTPGAEALIAGMTAAGARTALVSGGFTIFTASVAERLGMHTHHGNRLELDGDRLTGRIHAPVLDARTKCQILLDLAASTGLATSQVLAVGDGANDLLMLEAAGLGVAFRAKPLLRHAMARRMGGAVIDHADLTALLHLQGLATT
jgi:phosphoserine phosphatase